MEKEDFLFDYIKCKRKVLNLKGQFKKVKIFNSKSGNEPKSCPFYDELNEIFHKDPSIIPISTCSNLIKQSEFDEKSPRKPASVCIQPSETSTDSQSKKKHPIETGTDKQSKKTQPAVQTSTAQQPKKKQKNSDRIISLLEEQQKRDQERTASQQTHNVHATL